MTRTIFSDKLPAGIPAHVPIAHKVGVYESGDPELWLYTDCGIVFVPKRPFLLCVMMRGTEEEARKHMTAVATMAYDYVRLSP